MTKELIYWDIYEIKTESSPINGVMLRGRIRKFCLENNQNVLAENTQDIKNSVRFAIPTKEDATKINNYINQILQDATIILIKENIPNPILSKLKVNLEERYTL